MSIKKKDYPKLADILKESLDRKVISMSLDEYENMKGMIEDQKEKIEELRAEKEPIFTFRIELSTMNNHHRDRDYMMSIANQFGLSYHMMFTQLKAVDVSDNQTMNVIKEMVDEKLRQAKSFEESAYHMILGLRKKQRELDEAYERAPWWCRWAIKPNKNGKESKENSEKGPEAGQQNSVE